MTTPAEWQDWLLWMDLPPQPNVLTLGPVENGIALSAAPAPSPANHSAASPDLHVLIVNEVPGAPVREPGKWIEQLAERRLLKGGYLVVKPYAFESTFAASAFDVRKQFKAAVGRRDHRRFFKQTRSELRTCRTLLPNLRIFAFPRNNGWLGAVCLPALVSHILTTGRLNLFRRVCFRILLVAAAVPALSRLWPFQFVVYRNQT